jgi:predicted transcriptional regulator
MTHQPGDLDVIDLLRRSSVPLTLWAVAVRLNLTRPYALRLLSSLVSDGVVERFAASRLSDRGIEYRYALAAEADLSSRSLVNADTAIAEAAYRVARLTAGRSQPEAVLRGLAEDAFSTLVRRRPTAVEIEMIVAKSGARASAAAAIDPVRRMLLEFRRQRRAGRLISRDRAGTGSGTPDSRLDGPPDRLSSSGRSDQYSSRSPAGDGVNRGPTNCRDRKSSYDRPRPGRRSRPSARGST